MEAWTWGEDAFPPLDFAVRALVDDGMQLGPFDQHAGGDGTLRAVGLTPETWLGWVSALVNLNSAMSDHATLMPGGLESQTLARGRATGEQMMAPWTLVPGTDELRARLRQMWDDYRNETRAWERPLPFADLGVRRLSGRMGHALWKDLARFHDRLSTLTVFLVSYPSSAVVPIPPTSCLIAPESDPAAYADQVREAARSLVSHP
jgi:hypothetical protein